MAHPEHAAGASGRTIALFPGAFQPPHGAHLAAVRYLRERPDVDHVVVIISNRNRGIPGTRLSLDARLSERIWQIYLEGETAVRTEIAPHTAVDHALTYVERAGAGDRLLYCIGEEDLKSGDGRFDNLRERARERGVEAEVVPLPTGGIPVRATGLRKALARGEAGRASFLDSLPAELSADQRTRVWQLCCGGLRHLSDLALERLKPLLAEAGFDAFTAARCMDRGRIDPVFRFATIDGRRLVARYAGDAEGADSGEAHGMGRKPRRALKVERRVLALLLAYRGFGLQVPRERHFDRRRGVLLMDELLPDGETLATRLARGDPAGEPLARAGHFLARCHALEPQPLRNSVAEDQAQWAAQLARLSDPGLSSASGGAARNCLMWLHAGTRALRIDGYRMGAVDFEHAASWGDPACDLGGLLGDCLAQAEPGAHLAPLLDAYRRAARHVDPSLPGRVAGWAAERLGQHAAAVPGLVAIRDTLAAIRHATPTDWSQLLEATTGDH